MLSFYKKLMECNNQDILNEQRILDNKISKLNCYDTVSNYLLYLREHGRIQKEMLYKTSIFDYMGVIEKMSDDNNNIIQDLKNIMDGLNPCESLKEWTTFKSRN
jgi:hypothetical protein